MKTCNKCNEVTTTENLEYNGVCKTCNAFNRAKLQNDILKKTGMNQGTNICGVTSPGGNRFGLEVRVNVSRSTINFQMKPQGFWGGDMVRVWVHEDSLDKYDVELSWSSGGTDGTLSQSDTGKSLAKALQLGASIVEQCEEIIKKLN